MPARTNPHETRRPNLVSYIDELPRHGEREAYIWREGVRWRTRTYADLHRRGKLIGDADILIAATAIENNLTLVSNNQTHFSRITGLELNNWNS